MHIHSNNISKSLSDFEEELKHFSYKELTTEEAGALRKQFLDFKTQFEKKYWASNSEVENSTVKIALDNTDVKVPVESEESKLINRVSHKIITPLNAIQGFAELLAENKLTKNQEVNVNAIQTASSNLLNIVNELLEYSNLANGKNNLLAVPFNIKNVVKEISYLCNALIINKNVVLTTHIDSSLPEVLIGDPSKLSQILMNLLGNSIKFVEKGEIELKIYSTSNRNENIELQFTVSDTGIGVAQNNLKKVFEPFQQATKNTFSKYGGSGLGLSIVKQLIETLNGEIEIASRLGVGTVVKSTLPYKIGASKRKTKINKTNNNQLSPCLKGKRILVFEDNELNKKLINQHLKNWGCEVIITENLKYGINILKTSKIDLILMDHSISKMNGLQLSSLIRNSDDSQVKNTPIIILSTNFSTKEKESFKTSGINDFLLKPHNPEDLLQIIVKHIHSDNTSHERIIKKTAPVNISPKNEEQGSIVIPYKECDGDINMIEELTLLLKKNIIEFIKKVKPAIENNDFRSIEFATHKIKAGLKIFKANSLISTIDKMHVMSTNGKEMPEIKTLFVKFLEKYPKVDKEINSAIKKLK